MRIRELITEEEIEERVRALAAQISADYADKTLKLVCILKGASFFACDLAKRITVPVYMDFMACASYGDFTVSSGEIRIRKDLDEPVAGEHVLIAEDIIDSGQTLFYLKKELADRGAADVRICTLLDKPARRTADVRADYTGFTIPDYFVVGYGLDYAQRYRNLPYIGIADTDIKE